MSISERIRKRRCQIGLSQEELGKRLGVGKSCICKLKKENRNNMTTERIERIAAALEISPDELLGWNEINAGAGTNADTGVYMFIA